jgi:RND family efflux transporter MFP subunit
MSASSYPAPVPAPSPGTPAPAPIPVPSPHHPKRPPRWRVPVAIAVAGMLAGALYLALKPSQVARTGGTELVRTARVTTGPLERILRVAGQTSARNFAQMMVPRFRGPDSGRDLNLTKLAAAGSSVRKGDLVAEMDAQTLKDHLDDTRDQVLNADNNVTKKRADLDVQWASFQQNLRVAKANLDKSVQDARATEVKTDIERELLKLSVEQNTAAYKQLTAATPHQREANRADLRNLEIEAKRQHLNLDNHTRDLERFIMHAPMDGLIVMTQIFRGGEMHQVQLGDNVRPGMPIMKVVDLRSMQLEGAVSQADSSEFRIGQEAEVGLDAFPELRFKGRVYSVGAMGVKGMWDTYYIRNIPVRIAIEATDSRLIPDLSAWAHIRISSIQDAKIVPTAALNRQGGQDFVYVKRQQGFEKRAVKVGLRTATQAAIEEGLEPGEEVALSVPK